MSIKVKSTYQSDSLLWYISKRVKSIETRTDIGGVLISLFENKKLFKAGLTKIKFGVGETRKLIVLILLLGFLAIAISSAASAQKTQILGRWDMGASYDAIAYGNYLYVASGGQVRIYDISTKEKIENIKMEYKDTFGGPRKLGAYKEKTPPVCILHTGAGTIQGLYAYKNCLYVIGKKFVIADISDPKNAYILSSMDIGGKDVHVEGNYAYLTTPNPYRDDITIVDISDKKNPMKVAGIDVDELGGDSRGIRRLYVEGNYLYTGDYHNYLYIINISDPKNPSMIGKWQNPGGYREGPSSFAKKGNYVFVTRYHFGFYVIDVSDPKNPVKVAEVIGDHDPNANDIRLFGDYLFVSTRYEGFRIYNVSDPTNPVLVTKFGGFPGYTESIYVHEMPYGTYAVMTGFSGGWVIVDVTDMEHPRLMTWPWMPVPVGDSIKVKGNYAFIGSHNAGGWILNVSDPTDPREVAWVKTDGRHFGVEIKDNYWFLSYGWGDLAVVNISDPENPKFVYQGCGPNLAGYMVIVDNYLYAGGLRVYDISDPKHPKLVYNENLGTGQPFARYGDDYLVTAGSRGVFIIDISNRTNPKVVSNVSINAYTVRGRQLDISGGVVYVGAGNYLYSIDISDPENPVILDKVYTCGTNSVVVYGIYAYSLPRVASWGFRVIDISNPSDMKVIETRYDIAGEDMDEENGLLYTSGGTVISPIGGGEVPLQISLIKVSSIAENSAIVSWQTNKEADSLVKYGKSSGNYTEHVFDPTLTRYHSIKLNNLTSNTTYYFVVESKTLNEMATSTEKSFKTKAPDITPPVITIVYPENNSVIEGGTPYVKIKIKTDEPAICQYSFSDFEYGEGINFTVTGGTEHCLNLSVEDGKSYTLYYRCQDLSIHRNVNSKSTIHRFSIATYWWDYFDDETKIESSKNIEISNGSAKIKFPENKVYPLKDAVITPYWMRSWSSGKGDFGVGYFDRCRSILEFRLPNGTGKIKSVRLHLYVSKTDSADENNTILMHRLTKTFDEDDCNYKYRDESENLTWDNYGGDFTETVIDSVNVSGNLAGKWLVFTLKGPGAENPIDVEWGDTIGLILRSKIRWGIYRLDWFRSREAKEEQRPYLEIVAGSTSAYLISTPITPTSLKSWDKFYADYEAPEGTHISFFILDAETGEVLCSNLTGKGDDLSALSGKRAIRLKAVLWTENPPLSPILKEWKVSWISAENDTTPPITTTKITPEPNESGWINSVPVFVTFYRMDDTDVAYTNYSFSQEGPWVTISGNDTFNITITDEGTFTIWYYSVDVFGNKEEVKSITLKVKVASFTKNITVTHDAMLLEAATDYGFYPYIYIGKYGWRTCRGILKFDLSSIPSNARILEAKLILDVYHVKHNVSLKIHKLLAPWKECGVTWYTRDGIMKWDHPGGDFGPALESVSFNSNGKIVFESEEISEVVQEWIRDPSSNYGFLLEDDTAPMGKLFIIYQADWNEKLAPRLVVTYELITDASPPEIENASFSCTNNSATIEWYTNEISDSLVRYGTESGNYSHEVYDPAFVMHHKITIKGLEAGKTYYFKVVSTDTSGNTAESDEHKFRTLPAMPVTVVIRCAEDAWLAEHLYFRNYGWYPWMYIGNTYYGIGRGIIRFNLSLIPRNSTIIQAKLILKIDGPSPYGAPSSSSLSIHEVLYPWEEYEVTWNKRNKTEDWKTPGGDLDPTIIARASDFSGYPMLIFNITDVVKEWHKHPERNYGLLLEWDDAPAGKSFVIAQKEYYTKDAPTLEVTYMP
ncbi:MAG: hypothetical protein DRN19_00345 [Thermoplasmata archaeon]|nr:MAG: hypothetical protein DRN19_00345 [Thermoplasmata archaeon]